MSEIELDFLRSCLVIDGNKRMSVVDLLNNPYFYEKFKLDFEREFPEIFKSDLAHAQELYKTPQLKKDGREELPLYEILTESDVEEDDSDDDQNSSGQGE